MLTEQGVPEGHATVCHHRHAPEDTVHIPVAPDGEISVGEALQKALATHHDMTRGYPCMLALNGDPLLTGGEMMKAGDVLELYPSVQGKVGIL